MPGSLLIRIYASRFTRLAFRFSQREMEIAPTRAAGDDDHSYVKVTVYAISHSDPSGSIDVRRKLVKKHSYRNMGSLAFECEVIRVRTNKKSVPGT